MRNGASNGTPPMDREPRYAEGYWDNLVEYLRQSALLQHNDDYLEFLVTRVWRLDRVCRLAEFGCGFGKTALRIMRFLVPGSTYTGIDQSAPLISKGRQVWAHAPWQAEFHEGSVYSTPFPDASFDVTMTHAVLMHVPDPEKVLGEMIRVTKPGGLVIACEANRNAHTAMMHVAEISQQERVPLELFQTVNRELRERTGVDHNIGIKLPVLMHQAGLKRIEIRVSDAARFLCPPLDSEPKRDLFKALCDEGYGRPHPTDEQRERWRAELIRFGISGPAAAAEIARELEDDFLNNGPRYHTVYAGLLTWSFGIV